MGQVVKISDELYEKASEEKAKGQSFAGWFDEKFGINAAKNQENTGGAEA